MNLEEKVYKLIHDHKNEILDTGDWWWSVDNYDLNVFCYEDDKDDPKALFNINLYELDEEHTSSYGSNVQFDLEPMTRREIRLL